MHSEFRHLRFGLKRLDPVGARHSRMAQRAAAGELEDKLGADWRLGSRSHARGVIAVAVANPPVARLGIDVELADPRRPWREIASVYLAEAETAGLGTEDFCRLWTFGEAYFKAFGEVPSAGLLVKVARAPLPDDEPFGFASRRWWWSEAVGDGFMLSLVWEEAL